MHRIMKRFTAKNWISIGIIFVLMLIYVYLTMEIVGSIGVLTRATADKNLDGIWRYGLYMIVCALVSSGIMVIVQYLSSYTASNIATRLRDELYETVNSFALRDISAFSTESLITRTTNDIQNIHFTLFTAFRTVFLAPITMVWSIFLLIKNANASLTVVTGIWLFVMVATVVILIVLLIPRFNEIQKLTDALNVASRENLTGVRVVRAFNAEDYQQKKFTAVNDAFTKLQIFTAKAISVFTPVVMLVMNGLTLSILWVSAYLINGLDVEAANAMFGATNSFVMLATQVVMSFILLVTLIIVWPRSNVSAKRVNEVLTHSVSIKDPVNPVDFKETGTIEFKDVGFIYPGSDNEAVSDISFQVNRGETLAFIGATGSGKTTVVNMIARMTDCTRGEVLVGGVNVKDVTQENLHKAIGYVPQKAFLFKGNIKENLAFGNPDLTLSAIREAARIAEADDFISKKREGYDSDVAQGGTNFSGGQKQRLCIARAVALRPDILIFDDSFSALDYRTDKAVRANIENAMPDATRVIVAQRVGTIMNADQIIVLDGGKIVGKGKHEVLVRECPVYREIALSQMSREELGL